MSQNSYLREFCAQVSQIVLLTELTFFLVYYNCMREKVTKLILSRVLCTKVTNPGLGCFDRFTAYYNCIRKTVKSANNTICDTCVQNLRSYEFSEDFAHKVVISRKTVKSAKNTICDICAQNSRRYEFCDIFAQIVFLADLTV